MTVECSCKHATYQVLPTCRSCKHVFCRNEADDIPQLYCWVDKSQRPLCGSVIMNECFGEGTEDWEKRREAFARNHLAWKKWSAGREVSEAGVCSDYEPVNASLPASADYLFASTLVKRLIQSVMTHLLYESVTKELGSGDVRFSNRVSFRLWETAFRLSCNFASFRTPQAFVPIFLWEEWMSRGFGRSDGSARLATYQLESDVNAFDSILCNYRPKWATHVAWYNK